MATLALIIAVVALVIAIAAYRRTGGVGELQNQIQTLSSTTDSVRDRTADALNRLEQLVRFRASAVRSEEHTSELQSHSDLVCRLLLEKKKKKIKTPTATAKQQNSVLDE